MVPLYFYGIFFLRVGFLCGARGNVMDCSGLNKNIIIFSLLLFIAAYSAAIYPWMMDDAFIFFRYAENFSDGHGFVYNPGERVEGCTSFLWLLILSVAALFNYDLLWFSKIINSFLCAALVYMVANSHRHIERFDAFMSSAAAAVAFTSGIFAPWLSSGMEVPLFSFISMAAYFYTIKAETKLEYGICGVFHAMTLIARPEGIFLAAPAMLYLYWNHKRRKDYGIYVSLFKLALIYAPYFLWRYFYYGSLLPNTFHAKVGLGLSQLARGAGYFYDFFNAAAPLLILLSAAFFFVIKRRFEDRHITLLGIYAIMNIIFVIAVGGDFMYGFRFFAHLIPPLAIISVYALSMIFKSAVRFKTAVVIVIIYGLIQFYVHPEICGISNSSPVEFGREAGLFLKSEAASDALLAINTAGIIPYYSKLRTVDMLGLTDRHIATSPVDNFGAGPAGHEKGDGEYILNKKPDIIVMGNFEGSRIPVYKSDREIFLNAGFKTSYSLKVHKISVRDQNGKSVEKFFYYFERKK